MKKPTSPAKFLYLTLISLLIFQSCSDGTSGETTTNDPDKEEWVSMFNGKDMKEWTPKITGYDAGVNHENVFLVKDNFLSVRYEPTDTFSGEFGHLFYKDKFSHYKLRATYRFVGDQQINGPGWAYRHNGLMLHCQAPATMTKDQEFPLCLELQLLGGNGTDERTTGNLCSPLTNVILADTLCKTHCINSNSKTYHGDQWVKVEAHVYGDSLFQHIIEGDVVFSYRNPTVDIPDDPRNGETVNSGYISIQAETHPIDFKSIEILNLCGCMDKKAKNYKSYFVKNDKASCVY